MRFFEYDLMYSIYSKCLIKVVLFNMIWYVLVCKKVNKVRLVIFLGIVKRDDINK